MLISKRPTLSALLPEISIPCGPQRRPAHSYENCKSRTTTTGYRWAASLHETHLYVDPSLHELNEGRPMFCTPQDDNRPWLLGPWGSQISFAFFKTWFVLIQPNNLAAYADRQFGSYNRTLDYRPRSNNPPRLHNLIAPSGGRSLMVVQM